MPLLRITKAMVRRDVQTLIRTFPSEPIVITRASGGTWNDEGDFTPGTMIVYQGEALVAPAGGMVSLLGLGQLEIKNPQVLISGAWPVEQGDKVVWQEREYRVQYEPNYWQAFLLLTLEQSDGTA